MASRECRICLSDDTDQSLISPCDCAGSMKFVHFDCLVQSIESINSDRCEICTARYRNVTTVVVRRSWSEYVQHNPIVLYEISALVVFYAILEAVLCYQISFNRRRQPLRTDAIEVPVTMHLTLQALLAVFYIIYSYASYKQWRAENAALRVVQNEVELVMDGL